MTHKVNVMYSKSMILHRLKYDTPKDQRDEKMIEILIDDIRALAGDIYNDRDPYKAGESNSV